MGYFDSAKKRVLWNNELDELKSMREQFRKTGIDPYEAGGKSAAAMNSRRSRMTFHQLELESERRPGKEAAARQAANMRTMKERTLKERTLKVPSKMPASSRTR